MLFFHGEAVNIGLLGKLAMKLHVFAKQEDEGPKLKKQKHKAQLDERKLDIKLLAAQKKEQEARVSEETGGLLFEANVAKAELKLNARDDELEAKFRSESGLTACLVLACTVCLEYVYLTSARAYGGMGRVGQALAGLWYGGMLLAPGARRYHTIPPA